MRTLKEVMALLDATLEPWRFQDYCPNGLQVEGSAHVKRIVTGVTASQALIDAAIAHKADAIVVHHGYFWKGEDACVTGLKKQRLSKLLAHNISLLAYHLPLDAHPELGNNAQLAKQFGWQREGSLMPNHPQGLGDIATLDTPVSVEEFSQRIAKVLGRNPQVIAAGLKKIQRIAWCTGAAQSYIDKAIALGVDAYISGEISEPTVHSAREAGIHYFACGHHATERYGVRALGEYIQEKLGIAVEFVDIDNPV